MDLGIYLVYLAGLALVESERRRRLHVFLIATIAFGFVSVGGLSGDSIGGGLLLLIGYFMNAGLGLVLVALVVKQHRLGFSGPQG